MLPRGQQVKEDVMLGTDTHETPHIVQIVLENIVAVDSREAITRPQHPRQHRDHRGLTGTVMAEQRKDLTFVHADVDTVDSAQPITKGLPQVLNL